MSAPVSKPVHTISVRDLVEFVLRQGDLGGEREFVGSDRALAGIRGHQKIQRSRPTGYLTELPVEHRVEADEFTLLIRGRIDGLLITSKQVLLEEIKTVQGKWDHTADPLHWAQAKFYGFMHAQENGLKELVLQLVYLELPAGKVTEFRQTISFTELLNSLPRPLPSMWTGCVIAITGALLAMPQSRRCRFLSQIIVLGSVNWPSPPIAC
jgi:DNA excision repair protein ERCC-2